MELRLVLPTTDYKEKLLAYKADFLKHGDSMDGTAGLKDADSFEAWFALWRDNLCAETVREGLVPSTTFLAVDENDNLLGMIDLRHCLNAHLLQFGGHIGYSVLRAARRKGVARKMLSLALLECRKRAIDKVLLTCDKSNIASAKTILNNGGVLENEVQNGDKVTQRYWICL